MSDHRTVTARPSGKEDWGRNWGADYCAARRLGLGHADAQDAAQNAALEALAHRHNERYAVQRGGFRQNRIFWESVRLMDRRRARERLHRECAVYRPTARQRFAPPDHPVIVADFVAWSRRQVGDRAVDEVLRLLQHTRHGEAGGGAKRMARERGMSYRQLHAMRARCRRAIKRLRDLVPPEDRD